MTIKFPWQLYLVFNAIFDVCLFLDEANIFIIVLCHMTNLKFI